MFYSYQTTLSGSGIQNGAVGSFTGSLDDKGIQFAYNRDLAINRFFYNLTVSAKTEEANKDSFLTIFSKNNFFTNDIVYSGGADVFFFLKGTKSFTAYQKKNLHLEINDLLYQDKRVNELSKEYADLDAIATDVALNLKKYSSIDINGSRLMSSDDVKKFNENLKKLKKAGVIDSDRVSDAKEIDEKIKSFKKYGKEFYYKNKILTETDSLQFKARTAIGQHWFTLGVKYNINPKTVLDSNFPTDTLRTKTYENDNVSVKFSYNYFKKFSNLYIMFSPTLNFANQRNFNTDNLIKCK